MTFFFAVECIDFFLLWCLNLSYIVVKAQMDFFTDNYLRKILETNPFQYATKISISSDKYVSYFTFVLWWWWGGV